jgi:hypothetical protein
MVPNDGLAAQLEDHRPYRRAVAWRMLGSLIEPEERLGAPVVVPPHRTRI